MVRPRWSTIEQGFARGTRVDAPDIHHLQYAQDVWWCFFFADQQIWRWSSRQSLHALKLQKAAAFPSSHRNYFQTPLKLALSKLSESWRQVPRSRLFTPFPLYFDHLVFSALEVHSHLHALMSRHEQTLGKKLFQMETRTSSWTVEFSQLDSLKKWEEMNMILIYFN